MTETQKNPLIAKMQRVVQGTTIRLPSKGLFYDNGELREDVIDGQVVVYPMATLDEIIIRSPDMLLQGTAVEQVLGRCVPQILKPSAILSKDVDYLLVMLRKISYGDKTTIPFTCPICDEKAQEKGEKAESHDYPLSMSYFVNNSKEIEAEAIQSNYTLTLENSMVIHLRPSTFAEMVKMFGIEDTKMTAEEIEDVVLSSILSVIKDVDGIKDREIVKEWLHAIPVSVKNEIIGQISNANNFGPTFSYVITCVDCKKEHDINYILNPVSFFTLPSKPKTE